MARRSAGLEDLMAAAALLPWKVAAFLALASLVLLHVVAAATAAPVQVAGLQDFGRLYEHAMIHSLAALGQFVVPPALAVGAAVSFFRRAQTRRRFDGALRAPAETLQRMTWRQFEGFVGELFRRRGFQVTETGASSGDGGVDLVLAKDGDMYLVQCKHWRTQSVGVSVVRELNGVVAAKGARGGFVVTTGSFTEDARAFARGCRIGLKDGRQLRVELERLSPALMVANDAEPFKAVAGDCLSCPKCDSPMVRRVARRGPSAGREFWGCSRYPACRATVNG
jgi:restriction system protein